MADKFKIKFEDMGKSKRDKHEYLIRQDRARSDLAIQLIRLIDSYESKEEPDYSYTLRDKQFVLAKLLKRSLE